MKVVQLGVGAGLPVHSGGEFGYMRVTESIKELKQSGRLPLRLCWGIHVPEFLAMSFLIEYRKPVISKK